MSSDDKEKGLLPKFHLNNFLRELIPKLMWNNGHELKYPKVYILNDYCFLKSAQNTYLWLKVIFTKFKVNNSFFSETGVPSQLFKVQRR